MVFEQRFFLCCKSSRLRSDSPTGRARGRVNARTALGGDSTKFHIRPSSRPQSSLVISVAISFVMAAEQNLFCYCRVFTLTLHYRPNDLEPKSWVVVQSPRSSPCMTELCSAQWRWHQVVRYRCNDRGVPIIIVMRVHILAG